MINFLKSMGVYAVGVGVVSGVYLLAVVMAARERGGGDRDYYPPIDPGLMAKILRESKDAPVAVAPVAVAPVAVVSQDQ